MMNRLLCEGQEANEKRRCGSSAQAIDANQDLLTEILVRVPAKPLIRFKCVSKRWLSLISESHFCRRHTLCHPTSKVSGIFLRRAHLDFEFVSLGANHSASPFKSLNFVPDPAGIKILQSCNGLLLCSTFRRTPSPPKYYVYNPTTKQFSVLPDPHPASPTEKSVTILGVNLAFDPTRSPNYSVVCVRSTAESCYHYQIVVYSSEAESGGWRPCGSPFVAPHDMGFEKGVYWDGAIHWFSSRGAYLCFDLSEECLRNMPRISYFDGCFVASACGHLHLVEISRPCIAELRVFRLERDNFNFRWISKCHVDLTRLAAAFPEMVRDCNHRRDLGSCYAFVVLSIVENDHDSEDSSLLLHIPGKVVSYSFKDKTLYKICDLTPCGPRRSLQFGWFDAYVYIETLACV